MSDPAQDLAQAGHLLEAAKRRGADQLTWMGSDTWMLHRNSVVYGREEVVRGAIAFQPLRSPEIEETLGKKWRK